MNPDRKRTIRLVVALSAAAVPVRYTGTVPDPFREGREVIVTVHRQGAGFVGERDSLVTKCPSKFTAAPNHRTY